MVRMTALTKLQQSWNLLTLSHPFKTSLFLGALSAFAMPPWGMIPFFIIGFSGLIYIIQNTKNPKYAFLNGWAYGFGYFTVSLYWIGNAVLVYADEFWWAYPFALIGLPIYLALFMGLSCYLAAKLSSANSFQRFFALLFLLTLFEWARGYVFTGFPWNTPGLMWIAVLEIAQVASIGGLMFLSCLTLFWSSALYLGFYCKKHRFGQALLCVIALSFIASFVYGRSVITAQNKISPDTERVDVIIIQPNITQAEKWDPELIPHHLQTHMRLTSEALLQHLKTQPENNHPMIVVWPETALAYYILDHPRIRQDIKDLLRIGRDDNDIFLITGLLDRIDIAAADGTESDPLFSNALVALSPAQGEVARYGKHHLVPFGEYMPFSDYLGWTPLVKIGGFEAAPSPKPLSLSFNSLSSDLKFLPLICYEIIFPKYSHAAASTHAIINITNDAWYGNSAGPVQHLAISQFRAIEQSRPVIRSANTGISAMIDAQGRLSDVLDYGQEGTINTTLFLKNTENASIFHSTRHLFVLLYLCCIITAYALCRRMKI